MSDTVKSVNNTTNDKCLLKISEITKTIGASRKALQEYDKMGLVHPTTKTEGGYWLYDDEAIKKIKTIQMFSLIGYTRNEIKEFFDYSTDCENYKKRKEMCLTAVERLKKKREQLDGLIVMAEYMSQFFSQPKEIVDKYESKRIGDVFVDGSMVDNLKRTADYLSNLPKGHRGIASKISSGIMQYSNKLNELACLQGEDYESDKVQGKVEEAFVEWNKVLTEALSGVDQSAQNESMNNMSLDDQLMTFRNFFDTAFKGVGNPPGMTSNEEVFNKMYGEATGDNIRRMVDIFIEKRKE